MILEHETQMGRRYPDSKTQKPAWSADWFWVGGVSPTAATISAAGLTAGLHQLVYWTDGGKRRTVDATSDHAGVARFELGDLRPDTYQHYRLAHRDRDIDGLPDATFRTPPSGAHPVTIAFGSCARTGSNGAVFDAIRALEPQLFIHLGDLHYGNLTSRRPDDHLFLLTRALSTPAQSALFSSVPSAWIWDDHDYGPNDSDSSSPSRRGALDNYRRTVPSWHVDADPESPINQAFSVGRVRVVIIDTRSRRTPRTMLGAQQESWLTSELIEGSRTHALVVWANPAPWNVPDRAGSDQWGGYADERGRIATAIARAGIDNLVMASGDWHLSAIDDGTNTGYAEDGTPGFPLIHGAPLDRPGARTNEPYTHGLFSNPGQFGSVHVADDGGRTVDVTLTSHLWTGQRLGDYTFTVDTQR